VRLVFDRYPKLRDRVRFEAIAELPTPVVEHRGVWVKRDDLIGGGKTRKLEFFHPEGPLLAVGAEGSNWLRALAARRKDLRILTWPQAHNEASRRNMPAFPQRRHRDFLHFGLRALVELPRVLGGTSTLVPIGGSDPVTTLGWVNAAFELAEQVRRGDCPAPDAIFVALGTCGTSAGLSLGLALAGLTPRLHAVRIAGPWTANRRNLEGMASQTAWLLDELPRSSDLVIERDYVGRAYGATTPESATARAWFAPLVLDDSYTAKAAACLLARREEYKRPLLWLTYSAGIRGERLLV
jgi:D-cysteine desulfhydrase